MGPDVRADEQLTTNPGGPEDPLGESVLEPGGPWCRFFEPVDVRVVIGRYQDPEREVDLAAAAADGVPVHRRLTGGGAVVLAPGSLVIALRLRVGAPGTAPVLALVDPVVAAAAAAAGAPPLLSRGLGDLAVGENGVERKVLGSSLRRRGDVAGYLGVLLVDDLVPLMERYLRPPSRRPGYREDRDHRAFCSHLGRHGVAFPDLRSRIETYCFDRLAARSAT